MDVTNNSDAFARLKKLENAVAACNRCGFCTSYCPTYNASGNEVHSPRGRNQLARALMEGKIKDPAQVKESIDSCLLCGECTSVCFSEVPTAQIMVAARHYLNRTLGIPAVVEFFIRDLLPNPGRFRWLLKLAFLGKKLGVSTLLRKTGLLRRVAPPLAFADALLDKAPGKFLLDRKNTYRYQEKRRSVPSAPSKIAYMPVCGSQYVRPEIGAATVALFERLKLDFRIPEVACCGLPAASYGINDQVRTMGRENIERLERGHYETIVVDDSSCGAHLKDLVTFFTEEQAWLKRSHDLGLKFRELSTFLVQRGLKEHLKMAAWDGGPVAYHDPCKAQYGQKLTNPPRELLAAVPRLRLVPIADSDQCCGGAGTYSVVRPEMSQQVLNAKITNIINSGCKIVVTSSASCLIQLRFGLRERKADIEALHLAEFLVRALDKRR